MFSGSDGAIPISTEAWFDFLAVKSHSHSGGGAGRLKASEDASNEGGCGLLSTCSRLW